MYWDWKLKLIIMTVVARMLVQASNIWARLSQTSRCLLRTELELLELLVTGLLWRLLREGFIRLISSKVRKGEQAYLSLWERMREWRREDLVGWCLTLILTVIVSNKITIII